MDATSPVTEYKPGIYLGLANDVYHAAPGISKSGLWTIHTQSPAHYKYGVREEKTHFDVGEAAHLAILQPNEFEARVWRGPDDRRGNKWKDAAEVAAMDGKLLLTSGDYDDVLAIRDCVHADQWISGIITGGERMVEASGFHRDPETGITLRVRPDLYRRDLGVIVDAKFSRSAHPDAFSRSVVNYGYHAQEAYYTDVWSALGQKVEAFVFIAWEKEKPYAHAVYELPPAIVEEGRAIMRRALSTYVECDRLNYWPGYPAGVQPLDFKRWAYRLTEAPADEQA